jgi:hypothetical protein
MVAQVDGPSILDEDTLTLTKAAKEADVHVATIHRWASRGVQGVRLATAKLGGKRVTSRQAIRRFSEELTAASSPEGLPSPTASAAHQRAIDAAEREAQELGI